MLVKFKLGLFRVGGGVDCWPTGLGSGEVTPLITSSPVVFYNRGLLMKLGLFRQKSSLLLCVLFRAWISMEKWGVVVHWDALTHGPRGHSRPCALAIINTAVHVIVPRTILVL